MKKADKYTLIKKSQPVRGIYDFTVRAPEIAAAAECGQFLHIDCGESSFLRRPISICDAWDGNVRFIFEVKGIGTAELAKKEPGDMIDIMGPLGNSFIVSDEYKKAVIIGGGIGIFPLYALAKRLDEPAVFLGFRTADRVVMEDEFRAVSEKTFVSTDDGSYGLDGYAVNYMEKYLDENEADIIYSCGPMPLLRAVKRIAEERSIKCRLSLEQRMGCGIGACLVCSCETIFEGTDRYKRVCKDGPVFWSGEVTLND